MRMSTELRKLRQEIDYCFKEFKGIGDEKKFKTNYGGLTESEKLETPTKGYELDNPSIEFLKTKKFCSYYGN